jgi:hypothetical protein
MEAAERWSRLSLILWAIAAVLLVGLPATGALWFAGLKCLTVTETGDAQRLGGLCSALHAAPVARTVDFGTMGPLYAIFALPVLITLTGVVLAFRASRIGPLMRGLVAGMGCVALLVLAWIFLATATCPYCESG